MLKETDKAWAAGVIDFRGRIYTKQNPDRAKGTWQVVLVVDVGISEIAERLCAMTGVSPEAKANRAPRPEWTRRGCDEHCPEAHIHVQQFGTIESVKWAVTGVAAAIVLWNLRGYMSTVHQPWTWAMDQCLAQAKLKGRGSAMVTVTAQRLAELGWDLPPQLAHLAPKMLEAAR